MIIKLVDLDLSYVFEYLYHDPLTQINTPI